MTVYEACAIKDNIWAKGYLPLFTSGGGDYFLINLNTEDLSYGMISLYSPVINMSIELISIFDSVYNFFLSVTYFMDYLVLLLG